MFQYQTEFQFCYATRVISHIEAFSHGKYIWNSKGGGGFEIRHEIRETDFGNDRCMADFIFYLFLFKSTPKIGAYIHIFPFFSDNDSNSGVRVSEREEQQGEAETHGADH